DIKRYSYEFANLWLINTHNGIKEKGIKPVDTSDFPAIKKHLDQYSTQLQKRYDKGDSSYNLRNCAYMDDFSKQKIIWKRVGSLLKFCYDESGVITLDSTCFATGKFIKYLIAFLNSSIGNYLLQDSPKTGTGDLLVSVQAINPIVVPIPKEIFENKINLLIDQLLQNSDKKIEDLINSSFYDLFNFSLDEIEFIEIQ
ncbi:TaqI-like C-terminal specificity domain-containing protein, partial [Kaistella sp. SH11-4b]